MDQIDSEASQTIRKANGRAPGQKDRRSSVWWLAFLLLVGGLAQSYAISRPFSPADHDGWGGAFYSNIARNYLRYGYWETGFAPVVTTGDVAPEQRLYYVTHPPLVGLTVSFAFRLLGEHEWSARLVPLVFSVASLGLLYLLGVTAGRAKMGLVGAFIAALVPMSVVYGAHVDVQGSPVTFFSLLLLLAYGRGKSWLMYLALVVGSGFDWPVHYMAGLVALHSLFSKGRSELQVLLLPFASLLLAGAFFLYARQIAPSPEDRFRGATAWDAFNFWTGQQLDTVTGYRPNQPGIAEWLTRIGTYSRDRFTLPILFLAPIGLGQALLGRFSGWLVLLFSWAALHVLVFPIGAFVHDYWMIYLTPGLALASAVPIVWVFDWLCRRPNGAINRIAIASAYGIFGGYLGYVAVEGWAQIEHAQREQALLGKKLNQITPPGQGVLAYRAVDFRDKYYADRRITDHVRHLELFERALADPSADYRYFVVPRRTVERETDPELIGRLESRFPRFYFQGRNFGRWRWKFYIYDLKSGLNDP